MTDRDPLSRPPGTPTPNVLVVEDDPDLCRTLVAGLEAGGCETRVVYTAIAGLAQAREWRPDVVLLDLRLPDLDGLALIGRLAADPRTADLPILALAREADAGARHAACAAGARAVIPVPPNLDLVRGLVAAHARRREAAALARAAWEERAARGDTWEGPRRPARGGRWESAIGQGISRLVHADLDAERVYQAVVDGAQELLGLALASLWLVDGDALELRVQTAFLERATRREARIAIGSGLIGAVAQDGAPLTITDVATDARVRNRAFFEQLGLHAFVAVPLLHDGRLLGVLSGARTEAGPVAPEDVQMLGALADHAAAVLTQARQLHESERRRQTAEALAALATEVSAAQAPEAVLDRVLDYVRQLVGADVPYLDVVRPLEGQWPILKLEGARGERLAKLSPLEGRGVGGWVLARGRPFRTPDYLTDPRITHDFDDIVREEGITAALAVPVHIKGESVGVLGAMRRGPRPFTEDDERVLVQLAAHAAVALGNVWLYREVARGKQQWETTVDHLYEGLALVDPELRILQINRTLARWIGEAPEVLVGRALDAALPLYAAPAAKARLARALAERGPRSTAIEEGPGRALEETLAPVAAADGTPTGLVVMLRDVTEARRMSAQLLRTEKLVSLGEMLAGVAHELNNPLTGVLGFAQLLEGQVADPAHREDLRKLAQEALRAARLVQNLLRFSRQHAPERRTTDVNLLVRAAIELVDAACRTDGIAVEAALAPDLPATWVDPHQLQQVVVSLLTNAHQAMAGARRTGRIRVATRWAGGRLELEVADEGPGIPPDVLPRIFDPFFTTKAPGEGTGLGLSLCHSAVTAHEGEIWAESVPGAGAVLRVRLPIVLPPEGRDAGAPAPAAPAAPAPAAAGAARRVLVAEDEPALRVLVLQALEPRGHLVETVADGAAALERLAAAPFDVLLLDLRMPGMDGRATLGRLRAEGAADALRVVVMTGDSVRPETRDWIEASRVPVLHKPFTLQALVAAVEG